MPVSINSSVYHVNFSVVEPIMWEGTGGREPGRIRAGGEREAGEDGAGCGCRVRAGCGRRMQDAKVF